MTEGHNSDQSNTPPPDWRAIARELYQAIDSLVVTPKIAAAIARYRRASGC